MSVVGIQTVCGGRGLRKQPRVHVLLATASAAYHVLLATASAAYGVISATASAAYMSYQLQPQLLMGSYKLQPQLLTCPTSHSLSCLPGPTSYSLSCFLPLPSYSLSCLPGLELCLRVNSPRADLNIGQSLMVQGRERGRRGHTQMLHDRPWWYMGE